MLQATASELAKDLPALTRSAIENLHDPDVLADAGLDSALGVLLDRLCFSLQLSKPVGLGTWAVRESRRIGNRSARALVDAAIQAIADRAAKMRVNHTHLLTILEAFEIEIDAAFGSAEERVAHSETNAPPESTIALLAMLAEADALTCCHSKATGEWTRRLCQALHLPKERTEFIVLCALLHDIGKVSTPDYILQKPGALTTSEWDIMREHAAAGQRILAQIPSLSRCALVVRAHHERYDGTGYPDGLAGETIPFEARVVAVSDAFHAMISDRPYRKAIAPRRALEILREGSGTQWDPVVVEAMLRMLGAERRPQPSSISSTATA